MSIKFIFELLVVFSGTFFLKIFGFLKNSNDMKLLVIIASSTIGLQVNDKKGDAVYVTLLTIFTCTLFIINVRKNIFRITIDNLCILVICIMSLTSISFEDIYDLARFWTLNFTYITIFLLGIAFSNNVKGWSHTAILKCFTYVAIYNGILGVLQFLTNKKLLYGQFNSSLYFQNESGALVKRVVGIAGTNNAAGNLGFLIFAAVLFNYLRTKEKIHLFALACTSVFSILTLTRIGYVAIGLTVAVNFVITKWDDFDVVMKKIMLCFLGLIAVAIVAFLFGDQIIDVLFKQRGNTQDARGVQFKFVFKYIINEFKLLSGIGTGQYIGYSLNTFSYVDIDIHSEYITLWAEDGFLAFVLFIIFNIYLFINAFLRCGNRLEIGFVLSLFFGNIACCNFNPNQYYFLNNVFYYLFMYSFAYKKNRPDEEEEKIKEDTLGEIESG